MKSGGSECSLRWQEQLYNEAYSSGMHYSLLAIHTNIAVTLEMIWVSLCRLHSDAIALNLLTSLQGVATPSLATVWIFFKIVGVVIRVKQKQLNLRVGTERMIFNIKSSIKHSYLNDDTCFSIDVIDEILEEDFDALLDKRSKILHSIEGTTLEEEIFLNSIKL
ncbi:hypothetical protein Tco_0791477 [Tanacetum coccineum]